MSQSEHRERIRERQASSIYNPTFRPSGSTVVAPAASPPPPAAPPEPPPGPPVEEPLDNLAAQGDAVANAEADAEEAQAQAKRDADEAAAKVKALTPDEDDPKELDDG